VAENFEDVEQCQVELTDERLAHIRDYHPDAVPFVERVGEVLRHPDVVRESTQDPTVVVHYKHFADILGGKFLAVVVKRNRRRFVLTAYLTRRVRTGRPL
jgi:hypothetical protein